MGLNQVKWVDFKDVIDERGRLTAIEANENVPFSIHRVFYVHQVLSGVDRGGHAHKDTDQVITCVHGSLRILLSDGVKTKTYNLDYSGRGVYTPRMIWIRMFDFSAGAVCLVLANTKYDRSKSLRTWDEYLQACGLSMIPEPAGRQLLGHEEVSEK